MKAVSVKMSTLKRLGTWSPRVVIPIVEEAASRGIDINTDHAETEQVRRDITWMQENAQKQRVLPLATRTKP